MKCNEPARGKSIFSCFLSNRSIFKPAQNDIKLQMREFRATTKVSAIDF